jgi:hypothetical protein
MNFGDAMGPRIGTVGRYIYAPYPARFDGVTYEQPHGLGRAGAAVGREDVGPEPPGTGNTLLIADEIVQPHSTHHVTEGILGEIEQIGPGDEQCVQRCERAGGVIGKSADSVGVGLADMPPTL